MPRKRDARRWSDKFLDDMDEIVEGISVEERVYCIVIGADFKCHLGDCQRGNE